MDGWGEYYREFTLGFHPSEVWECTCRNDVELIAFYGYMGLVTVQKITSLEFDGWEVWSTWSDPQRFVSVQRARGAVGEAMAELEEQALQE